MSADRAEKKIYKVFVSSTYLDNKVRLKVVVDAIQRAEMVPVWMERFTAEAKPTVEACVNHVKNADVLVGVIAWCYGWIPPGHDVSITELEYDAAETHHKDRLMFLLAPSQPVVPEEDFDQGSDRIQKQIKLEAFKERIQSDQMTTTFDDTSLGAKVLDALTKWREDHEKPGSSPAPRLAPDLDQEIQRYRQKAEALHANIPVAGFVTQLKMPIDVDDIYIPLRARLDLRGVGEERFLHAEHAEKSLGRGSMAHEIHLPDAFKQAKTRKPT